MIHKFDSDVYASNMSIFKSYNHLHYSQNYHTYFGHWFLTRFHALMNAFEQPHPYVNGILVRSEVSKQYPVTNIDMNIRFNREYQRGNMMLYPATLWNLRGTYSIKNKETTIKTWDANLIVNSNMGHTTTTVKGLFGLIIPGKEDSRICLTGSRKYTVDGIEGEAAIGTVNEPKCTNMKNIMEIKVVGEQLPEQMDNKHIYGECQEYLWSDLHDMNSLDCYMARDTLRKWTYDFKTFDMPAKMQKYVRGYYDWLKLSLVKYLTKYDEASMDMKKGEWKIVHEYPLVGDKVDLHVYTPDNDYQFSGIPSWKYPYYRYHMMSTKHFSPMFKIMHTMGWTHVCEIHQDLIYNSTLEPEEFMMPEDWTMYLGDAETGAKHGIWMKNLKGDDVVCYIVNNQ